MVEKEKPIKLYAACGYISYATWILSMHTENKLVTDIKQANMVLLAGGADVSPTLYGENHIASSLWLNEPRDLQELAVADYAIKNQIPMIGICRGEQLLCVLAGGKLVQDMNHNSRHDLTVVNHKQYHSIESNKIRTNSLHHQLAYPYNIKSNEYDIIAYAKEINDPNSIRIGKNSIIDVNLIKIEGEPEIIHFKKINGLGIQGHPEMMYGSQLSTDQEFVRFCKEVVRNTIWK